MQPAVLWRRIAALFYDGLLVLGLWFVTTGVSLAINGGEAVESDNQLLTGALIAVTFLFYGWFWTHGGQTLGMRAWKIKALREDGEPMTWSNAALRFIAGICSWASLGLGYLWSLIDPAQRTWHDMLSKTCVIFDPKAPNAG